MGNNGENSGSYQQSMAQRMQGQNAMSHQNSQINFEPSDTIPSIDPNNPDANFGQQ
jgi:hypothetical protein